MRIYPTSNKIFLDITDETMDLIAERINMIYEALCKMYDDTEKKFNDTKEWFSEKFIEAITVSDNIEVIKKD